ncbi:MAG: hypothetical protein ACYTEZ_07990 [Planctomycetota bacterium]
MAYNAGAIDLAKLAHRVVKELRRAGRSVGIRRPLPRLDETLAASERVFRAPPFTKELVAALKLIAPQFDFTTDEKSRLFWETEQNGDCWGEYNALAPLFGAMARPSRILEIGPGLGRSLVFFSQKLGWEKGEIHAYEGEGKATRYTLLGPRFEDSFCGNIAMLQYVLEHNGIRNVIVHNARDGRLAELEGTYDFLYSFYSIGFHWSLEHFLDDLLRLMHDESVAVFIIPSEFAPFPGLKELSYRVIDGKTAWPKGGKLKMLALSKKSLPDF